VLAAAGDEEDVVDAGGERFLDAVLDDRLVDERQHFLGLRLRRRKESCAETGRRKHRLAHRLCHASNGSIETAMLDPAYVRDHAEEVRKGLQNRGLDADAVLTPFAELDARRKALIPQVEGLKRDQNAAGEAVARAKREGRDLSDIFSANKA